MHRSPIVLVLPLYMFWAAFLPIIRLWYNFCSCDRLLPGVGWNEFHPTPSWLHKVYQSRCTAKNSWWWAERLPETCRVVIPIKLEFSTSFGFIHKESVTMHGHMIIKLITDVQDWSSKFPHAVVREVECSHSIPICFVSCVKCCTGVLSPVTVDSRNSFLSPLNHWKCERANSKHIFLLSSFRRFGTQRTHTLQYPSLLLTVFVYSSDGQLKHTGKIFNCYLSIFPDHLLHSCCIKFHPWCAK
jgi:hypothetical protein